VANVQATTRPIKMLAEKSGTSEAGLMARRKDVIDLSAGISSRRYKKIGYSSGPRPPGGKGKCLAAGLKRLLPQERARKNWAGEDGTLGRLNGRQKARRGLMLEKLSTIFFTEQYSNRRGGEGMARPSDTLSPPIVMLE